MRDEVRAGRQKRSWRSESASGMHAGRAQLKAGGQGTRGAHVEHVLHGCDLGRVEAQRLVERRRVLPSRKEGIRCRARYRLGGRRAWGGGGASSMHTGRARLKAGDPGTLGAHLKHALCGCEAGRVEAQRLVERRRELPRFERRAYGAVRGAGCMGSGRRRATAVQAACRGGLDCRLGAGHGEERT